MNELIQKYQFNLSQPIATPYQDSQIKNSSYKAMKRKDNQPCQLVVYKSKKIGQINSYHKKIAKLAQIKSPYLVPILDCIKDEEESRLFIVLEWNYSFNLRECLKQQILSQSVAVRIVRDLLKGLRQLHKVSILHSFINIQNIEIIQGRARLSFRYLIYKTYYLAPQVKKNHQKSQETDLFSLGVCLYKLIFGLLPFKQKTDEQYTKSVKKGIQKKISLPKSNFPIFVSQQVQDIINTLCHFQPKERAASFRKLQAFQIAEATYNKELLNAALGQDFELISVEQVKDQMIKLLVLHSKLKRIYSMDIIQHNLTQLSSYVEDIISPFKNQSNRHFANVKQFFPVLKNSIAIVYNYCAQGSLQTYRKNCNFDIAMIEEVQNLLIIVLTRWVGQYRFLNDQQILIKQGKPVIKFPPYPTSQLKKKLNESKKGNYFYAPQLQSGVQSLSADSWSYGALEYWMRFDCFPNFDKQANIIIKDGSKLTPQQIQNLNKLICLKARDRKNLFPLQAKIKVAPERKVSIESNSSNSNESPRKTNKLKSSFMRPKNKTLEIKNLSELPNDQELSDQIQLMQIDQNINSKNSPQNERKNRQSDPALSKTKLSQSSNIRDLNVFNQLNGESFQEQTQNDNLKRKNRRITKNSLSQFLNQSKMKKMNTDSIQLKEALASPQLKMSALSQEYSAQNKKLIKKSNRFGGFPIPQQKYSRDNNKIKKRNSISSIMQIKSKNSKKQKNSNLAVQEAKNEKFLDNLKSKAWKLSQIQTHWTKPLRIIVKCLLAILLYLFIFYFSFLSTNGILISNRYNYTTQQLYLKADKTTVIPTINFTIVTRNTSQAYSSLNNQTLDYVLYTVKCITNRYWTNSIILNLIQGSSFATYSVGGILIVLANFIMIVLAITKLDFPKAISHCQLDENSYVALCSWLIVNLGVATLTSMTFILYGGLFELQLDPCISWTNFPSLQLFFRSDTSNFGLRFSWIYIGIVIVWIIIVYLLVKPTKRLHKYVYGLLLLFYFATAGARSMSAYNSTKQAVIGACGQLLALVIGAILLIFDMIVSCCLRKLPRGAKTSATINQQVQINITEVDFQVKK